MPTNKSEESQRRELIELEHAFWNALKGRDGKTASKLTDSTTIVVGPQGIGELPKAAVGEMLEKAEWSIERFDIDPSKLKVKLVDDDVAVIAYEVDEKVFVDGKAETLKAFDTSVWVRRLGKWVCAMHTETLAGDPFGRDRTSH